MNEMTTRSITADPLPAGIGGGRFIDLHDPNPDVIEFEEIARALSRQIRFCGLGRFKITVAEHSINVSNLALDFMRSQGRTLDPAVRPQVVALAALLHDAHEAYIGDTPRPVLDYYARRLPNFEAERDRLTAMLDAAILAKAGVPSLNQPERELVASADDHACLIETAVTLEVNQDAIATDADRRLADKIRAAAPGQQAFQMFMRQFQRLRAAVAPALG